MYYILEYILYVYVYGFWRAHIAPERLCKFRRVFDLVASTTQPSPTCERENCPSVCDRQADRRTDRQTTAAMAMAMAVTVAATVTAADGERERE